MLYLEQVSEVFTVYLPQNTGEKISITQNLCDFEKKTATSDLQFAPFIQVYHSSLFKKYSKCFISNITYTKVTIAKRCVKYTLPQNKQNWQSYEKSWLN